MRVSIAAALLLAAVGSAAGVTLDELMKDDESRTPPNVLTYKTVGERELKLQVHRPDGTEKGKPLPAVVCIHGGGWSQGSPELFVPHSRYFASRGVVAVNVQYRLAKEKAGGLLDCLSDCKDAIRYIREHAKDLGVDAKRVAVVGDSAGGHLAAALGTLTDVFPDAEDGPSSRPNAMVLYNPVVDLSAVHWIKPDTARLMPSAARKRAGLPADWRKSVSPVFHVDDKTPPTLLMHGTADPVVPVEQARRFAKACKEAGVRCDYVEKKDWKHAFVVPNYGSDAQVVEAIRTADAFLADLGYLEGEPTLEPPTTAETKPSR